MGPSTRCAAMIENAVEAAFEDSWIEGSDETP